MGLADIVKKVANVFMETSAPGMITNAAEFGASKFMNTLPAMEMFSPTQAARSAGNMFSNAASIGRSGDPFSRTASIGRSSDPFSGTMGSRSSGSMFSQNNNNSFDSGNMFSNNAFDYMRDPWGGKQDGMFSPFDRMTKEKAAAAAALADMESQSDQSGGGSIDSAPGETGLKGNAANARVSSIKGTDQWNDLITKASKESGVPASLLKAIMALESGGNAKVGTNTSGATGLMQVVGSIWQGTANNYGNGDLNDPWTNIRTGAEILKQNKSRYGSWEGAAAAYIGSPVQRADGSWGGGTVPDANGTNGQMYIGIISDSIAYIEQNSQSSQSGGGVTVSGTGKAFPVKGYSGGLSLHHGSDPGAVDIFADYGTPVLAIAGGIASSGYSEIGGYWTLITDSNGVKYYYAHMDKMGPTGQVKTGSYIAGVSDTGNAKNTGAHLHLGIGTEIFEGTGPRGGAGNYNVIDFLAGTTRF